MLIVNCIDYLRRKAAARGFGIQSPWAYRFVTEVIGERLPYYGYAAIDRRYRDKRERAYHRLLLRLGNAVWPSALIEADIGELTAERVREIALNAGPHGTLVTTGISRSAEAKERWEAVKRHPDVGVTFDLYHFGIAMLDLSIYKQHYRLLL